MLKYTTFLFNIDGFIWNWKEINKEFIDLYKYIKEHNRRIVLLTNNSAYSKMHLTRKLQEKGLEELEENEIFTSTDALIHFLYKRNIKSIYLIGEYGLLKELESSDIEITPKADYVVIGIDRNITYAKIREAYNILKRNETSIIHLDNAVIWKIGDEHYPITYPLLKYFDAALNKEVNKIFVGKPSFVFKDALLKTYALFHSSAILVSNKLSDIEFAAKLGIDSMLVDPKSYEVVKKLSPEIKPKHISSTISAVKNLL